MHTDAKYMQTYYALKADIYNNYRNGSLLPPEAELMKQYGVSRTTLRHAIQLLKADNLIQVKQGQGTHVCLKKNSNDIFTLFHNVTNATHYFPDSDDGEETTIMGGIIDVIPATEKIAEALDIPVGAAVYRLERLIVRNEKPMILCRNYLRHNLFPGLEDYSGKTEYIYNIYSFFEWKYNVVFSSARQIISTHLASFFDAKLMDIESGAPLLLLRRTSVSNKGVFEYTEWLANPNMIQILITMEGARSRTPMPMITP